MCSEGLDAFIIIFKWTLRRRQSSQRQKRQYIGHPAQEVSASIDLYNMFNRGSACPGAGLTVLVVHNLVPGTVSKNVLRWESNISSYCGIVKIVEDNMENIYYVIFTQQLYNALNSLTGGAAPQAALHQAHFYKVALVVNDGCGSVTCRKWWVVRNMLSELWQPARTTNRGILLNVMKRFCRGSLCSHLNALMECSEGLDALRFFFRQSQ